jgi:hydroxymethylbilane synthase
MKLKIAARDSPLSVAQVEEIKSILLVKYPNLEFELFLLKSFGDKRQDLSLRSKLPSDFFTREIDELLISKKVDIAVHSAKDLPDVMCEDLIVLHYTIGVDPRDALVLKEGYSLETLPFNAKILASSMRREDSVKNLRGDLKVEDVRGTIEQRLSNLSDPGVYGVVVAEAALLRLKLNFMNRIYLKEAAHPLQGKLALVARKDREDLKNLVLKIKDA